MRGWEEVGGEGRQEEERGGSKGEAGQWEGGRREGLPVQNQGDPASYEASGTVRHQELAGLRSGPAGGWGVGRR